MSNKKRDTEALALGAILKVLVRFDKPTQIRMLEYLLDRVQAERRGATAVPTGRAATEGAAAKEKS